MFYEFDLSFDLGANEAAVFLNMAAEIEPAGEEEFCILKMFSWAGASSCTTHLKGDHEHGISLYRPFAGEDAGTVESLIFSEAINFLTSGKGRRDVEDALVEAFPERYRKRRNRPLTVGRAA